MHTPDGFLHPWMAGLLLGVAGLVVGGCLHRRRGTLTSGRVQLFGIVTAGIFAAQLCNWPLPTPVSAHFVGGALAAIVLGPQLAVLSVSIVVVVQAFVFADGGVLALGANVVNMAIVQPFAAYAIYRLLEQYHRPTAIVAAGWGSITLAGLAAGIELGLSPAFGYELLTTATVLGGGHALLGVGEGLLTLVGVRLLATSGVETDDTATEGTTA